MTLYLNVVSRVDSVYGSPISWTSVRRSWVDLRCTIGVPQDPIFSASSSGTTNLSSCRLMLLMKFRYSSRRFYQLSSIRLYSLLYVEL